MTIEASAIPLQKRCAVYTRKSSEHGLQQDFNSLKAQQAVCSAYIQSQRHRGWIEVEKRYEDAARSGATLERPAMKDLLADIERGKVDVVVVYKLDRLSRSLLDFVRLIDMFQRYDVAFACITQNFDTGDSLGRLVMNVLLTFAQFEREMTGDRIRDKKQAMALKGLRAGGRPPLGYDLVDHHLIVNSSEARIVGHIFELYLGCGNFTAVARACQVEEYRSKIHVHGTGTRYGGISLRTASVRRILMNPVYAGYVIGGGKLYQGIHQAIITKQCWDRVTELRARQAEHRAKQVPPELLAGLIYDGFGRSMTPNRLAKGDKIHVHYRSNQNAWGLKHRVKRMRANAGQTDQLVVSALQGFLGDRERLRSMLTDLGRSAGQLRALCAKAEIAARRLEAISRVQLRSVIHALVSHVEVSRERLKLVTRALEYEQLLGWDFVGHFRRRAEDSGRSPIFVIDVPCAGVIRLERYLRLPIGRPDAQARYTNRGLKRLVAEARAAWEMVDGNRELSAAELAQRCNSSLGHFMRMLRMNYLAPDIMTALLDGTQPRELTRRALLEANLPLDWALQRKLFGFPDQPPIRSCERF
jgi:site-specific DNA recombinase